MAMSVLLVGWNATAGEVPEDNITFTLADTWGEGGAAPSSQTYVPDLPLEGTGYLDLEGGTGSLKLPPYSLVVDVLLNGPDARFDITNWVQTVATIDEFGNMSATAASDVVCTDLGGGFGTMVCGTDPDGTWPPADGTDPSSAKIDTEEQTMTIVNNSSQSLAGTIYTVYTYEFLPEPSARWGSGMSTQMFSPTSSSGS